MKPVAEDTNFVTYRFIYEFTLNNYFLLCLFVILFSA